MPRRAAPIALLTVPIIVGLGFLSGVASNSGYGNGWFDGLRKPAAMPPAWAFPVAWTTLYVLLGIALALILATPAGRARRVAVALFVAQMALNLAWSPIFFGLHQPGIALAVIAAMLALAALAAIAFARLRRTAGLLLLPYLGWLCFAAWLNAEILRLN